MKFAAIIIMAVFLVSSVAAITNDAQLAYVTEKPPLQAVKVKGLENAMMRVRTEEAKATLTAVLEKITNKARINTISFAEIQYEDNDGIIVTGQKRLFLFALFPVDMQVKYRISDQGNITREAAGLDWLYVEDSLIFVPPEKLEGGVTENG